MDDKIQIPSDASHEQVEIIVGAMYLALADAFDHIERVEGGASARAFQDELVTKLKGGGVSMSLLDDAATFDFVVAMVDGLGKVHA